MVREYVRIEIEGKGFNVDLSRCSKKDIKIMLGTVKEKLFKAEKTVTLQDLEDGGFKLD